jgi:hypothetical protein
MRRASSEGSVLDMSGTKKSSAQLASEIARTAGWLADVFKDVEPAVPAVRRALERAHAALRVIPAASVRNQVCALLLSTSRLRDERSVESVRSFLVATMHAPEARIRARTDRIKDSTIIATLDAWGRPRGAPRKQARTPRGHVLDKWQATAALLKECGISVKAESIRKGWESRDQIG